MKLLSLALTFILPYQAFALSLSQKRERCYSLLVEEFQNALASDNGIIQAQLTLTGLKLAKELQKNKGEQNATLEALSKNLINKDFVRKLAKNSDALEKMKSMQESYAPSKKILSAKHEVLGNMARILGKKRLNDEDAGALIQALMHNGSSFDENDFAIAWFAQTAGKNFDNEDSYYLGEIVDAALNNPAFKDPIEKEKFIAKNMAHAQLKLKASLAKLKEKVFEANKRYCVSDYKYALNAQNRSVFEGCREAELSVINESFLDAMAKVLESAEFAPSRPKVGLLDTSARALSSEDIRALQDFLNREKVGDQQRILEYYKRGLYPDNGKCQTFTIVDKKNQKTSIYTIDGEEIFTTNSIQAFPRTGRDEVVFNPDSELRRFSNGTYSRATTAGVFYSILDMDPAQRKLRKYDLEFDDRVLVLSPREVKDGSYVYNDSTIIALHGVPINGYVQNASERLASFDGKNRNLSTGCVNVEAYAFDLLNGLSQNHCPLYILPEDDKNYFHIKNREMHFSTSSADRKRGSESAKRCVGGTVEFLGGETHCRGGSWVADSQNTNRYNFTPISRESYHKNLEVLGDGAEAAKSLWRNRERLIKNVAANNIDAEDFEDLVALTHGMEVQEGEAEAVFKDLYNAYYDLREKQDINFDRVDVEKKRKIILEYYLDPNGFRKQRIAAGRPVYGAQRSELRADTSLQKAREVRFIHGY